MNIVSYGNLEIVENALRGGAKLKGFLSGGGLRVLRVEDELGILVGYGEHPHASAAFRILADDIVAGGRDYEAVYGPIETHYLTGSSLAEDQVDAWFHRGYSFRMVGNEKLIALELSGFAQHKTPPEMEAAALAGATVRYEDARGLLYESKPYTFPNGDKGVTTRCVWHPPLMDKSDIWMWRIGIPWSALTLADLLASDIWAHNEATRNA
jgi:hypothetical protein